MRLRIASERQSPICALRSRTRTQVANDLRGDEHCCHFLHPIDFGRDLGPEETEGIYHPLVRRALGHAFCRNGRRGRNRPPDGDRLLLYGEGRLLGSTDGRPQEKHHQKDGGSPGGRPPGRGCGHGVAAASILVFQSRHNGADSEGAAVALSRLLADRKNEPPGSAIRFTGVRGDPSKSGLTRLIDPERASIPFTSPPGS
jgi:hypothetical protein